MIDKETFHPTLENCMNNFMQCSIMMFENKDRFGISFKLNAPDFVIYARRFFHNFTVHISRADNEGAVGANLSKKGEYVMADKTQVQIFCQKDLFLAIDCSIGAAASAQ